MFKLTRFWCHAPWRGNTRLNCQSGTGLGTSPASYTFGAMICDQNSLLVPRNRARESGRCSTGSDRTDKREITRKRRLRPSTSPHFEVSHSTQEAGQTGNASSRSDYFVSSPDSVAGSAASFDWGSAFTQSAVDAFRACPNFEREGVRHLCRQLCYLRAYEVFAFLQLRLYCTP